MKKIAVVTPNSDTFTNPTLTSLFHILKEQGIDVFLFGPDQQPSCPDNLTNLKFKETVFKLNLFRNPRYYSKHWTSYFKIKRLLRKEKIYTVLAVDPLGVIVGGRIKRFFCKSIKLSYLSFEIFFKKELSSHYLLLKEKEIYYSKFVDSLLIQDLKRRDLILHENNILLPENQIALVPVSPMKIKISEKPDTHKILNIPKQKKLVVYSGSVGTWCGTNAIIEAFDKGYWIDSHWLVFHTRTSLQADNPFYADLKRLDADRNIPFSLHPHPYDSFEELAMFLSGFDMALALYYPNNENPYYGQNMRDIGLSSGKFSMYMMLGLPTIVTPCDIYVELLKKYQFGAVISDIEQIGRVLRSSDFSNQNACNLYEKELQPDKRLENYINILFNLK
jgi:hypothetical protein